VRFEFGDVIAGVGVFCGIRRNSMLEDRSHVIHVRYRHLTDHLITVDLFIGLFLSLLFLLFGFLISCRVELEIPFDQCLLVPFNQPEA
jgi:hypothetical protein